MKSIAPVLVALLVCATPTLLAAQTVYECDMHSKGRGGFVGEKMFFELSPETSTGQVFDGIIKAAYNRPIGADVTKRTGTSWRYKWAVEDFKLGNGGTATVKMRATLNTQTGALSVSGVLNGYDNNISGAGKCQVRK